VSSVAAYVANATTEVVILCGRGHLRDGLGTQDELRLTR
jgi:hypothetical protein